MNKSIKHQVTTEEKRLLLIQRIKDELNDLLQQSRGLGEGKVGLINAINDLLELLDKEISADKLKINASFIDTIKRMKAKGILAGLKPTDRLSSITDAINQREKDVIVTELPARKKGRRDDYQI